MSTTVESLTTTANRILKALPLEEYERLSGYLEPVSMPLGEILCHPDEPITHVYFPDRGTVSLVSNFDDGRSVEVGMVGNEGRFGVCVFLGTTYKENIASNLGEAQPLYQFYVSSLNLDLIHLLPHGATMIQNHLLSALPEAARKDLFSHVTQVSLSLGEVLHRAEEEIQYVYFPETCVISMLAPMQDGSTVEVGVVGNEGMLGLRVLLGVKKTPHSAVVQVAGTALRMNAPLLEHDLRNVGSSLRPLLLPYTQSLLSQLSQSVACISQHSIRQRLSRWLLQMADRTSSTELDLTQELISIMLGIRRASAGESLREFRDVHLIAMRRGGIRIIDRSGLEKVACECYRIVKNEIDHLYKYSI